MKEQLISFETAKLAKEKGFNIPTIYGCNEKGESQEYFTYNSYAPGEPEVRIEDFILKWDYQVPTQSLLQKWLWETHKLWVSSTPEFSSNEVIGVSVTINSWSLQHIIVVDYIGYDVYKGLEQGLYETLKLIN